MCMCAGGHRVHVEVKGRAAVLGSVSSLLRRWLLFIVFLLFDSKLPDPGTSTTVACLHLFSYQCWDYKWMLPHQVFTLFPGIKLKVNKLVPHRCTFIGWANSQLDEIFSVISAYSVLGLHFPATTPEPMIRKPICDIIMIAPDLSSCTETKLALLRMSQYFPLLSWAISSHLQLVTVHFC